MSNRLSDTRAPPRNRPPAAKATATAADLAAKQHVRAVTREAGSSFYWAMRVLPKRRREAMFAIYAFCREVDDIADGDGPADRKRRRLDGWRAEIEAIYDGTPAKPTARALAAPVHAYGIRREDFLAVIDGMEMDLGEGIRAPTMAELETYCARVAGAVGLLSIRAFGATAGRSEEFAVALGAALQLTNILRDLKQDAALGRLYLPRELLAKHGIQSRDPGQVIAHPALARVCHDLAEIAWQNFADAERALAGSPRRPLRPAVAMMMNYSRILGRLVGSDWRDLDQRIAISKPVKIWTALRYGLF